MATTSTQWQLARDAARRYEEVLVPAFLGPAARALVEFAAPAPGETVIDVGCGTGVAARYAAERVGPKGRVIGIDVNTSMLEAARALPAAGTSIEWREANATALPLPDEATDVALCAQTLQFLADRPAALREMHRVLRRGGRIAVSVWTDISGSPYCQALADAVARHVGAEVALGLKSAFAFGDPNELMRLLQAAGFGAVQGMVTRLDIALPPLEEFVPRHVSATPMAAGYAAAAPEVQAAVIGEVVQRMGGYEAPGGARIPFATHLVRGLK